MSLRGSPLGSPADLATTRAAVAAFASFFRELHSSSTKLVHRV